MTEKLKVDMQQLTLRELSDARDVLDGTSLADVMQTDQWRGTAVLAYLTKRRTDPGFTFDQALDLRMADIELVNPDPEAQGAPNGAEPQSPPESGDSTPPTS